VTIRSLEGAGAMIEPCSQLKAWARALIDRRLRDFEEKRAKALEHPHDPEALHDVRTRARRLRAALEDLHDLIPEANHWLRVLKRLGRRTGAARDNDVLLERVEGYASRTRGATRAGFERMAERLRGRRRRLAERAIAAIKRCELAHDHEGERQP